MSNLHAHLVSKALIAISRGHLEFIGFSYPPFPFLLTAVHPTTLTPSLWAALASGVLLWTLWEQLSDIEVPVILRAALVLVFVAPAPTAFLLTQSLNGAFSLMFYALAWRSFLRFIKERLTWAGFNGGLWLGIAFFFNVYALFWGILYAASTFLLYRLYHTAKQREERQTVWAMGFILIFPPLLTFSAWSYLSWIFTGSPLQFLKDPSGPIYAFFRPNAASTYTLWQAAKLTAVDLFRLPVVWVAGILCALDSWIWGAVYALIIVGITLMRSWGFVYPEALAQGTFMIMVLMALPTRLTRPRRILLALAVVLQAILVVLMPSRTPEVRAWQNALTADHPAVQDQLEEAIAQQLAKAPRHSILADDRNAYRFIARGHTAEPYLLPMDATYTTAVVNPQEYVSYVLVAEKQTPGEPLGTRYAYQAPPGFVLSATWPGWRLYRRKDAPPLLSLSAP
ncbi:MAG: hypothetical protein GXO56_06270 [Chloroflexi bacterium]|nr:hypothetical protein [Chloroflexota bacterium]